MNNLRTPYHKWEGKSAYRKKQRWISEVDLCLVSAPLVEAILGFDVNQNLKFPSDHAPVSVAFDFSICYNTCKMSELVERSEMLGSYDCVVKNRNENRKKPISYRAIDKDAFLTNIQQVPLPDIEGAEVGEMIDKVTDTMYTCAASSNCLLYTSPSPRDLSTSRMPSSA